MHTEELIQYVRLNAQPDELDIELAKQTILDHLHIVSQSTFEPVSSSQLLSQVTNQKQLFDKPIPIESGYEPLLKDLLANLRAELAAREALISLHTNGIIIAYGSLMVSTDGHSPLQRDLVINNNNQSYYSSSLQQYIGSIYLPSIHVSYRLSALFQKSQTYRLASGDMYLASLIQAQLPSRAKRCIRECVDAFKYGLYLSATMSVGAASESLWMKLASLLVDKKPSVTNSLSKQLRLVSPSIYALIEEAWQVLVSQFIPELEQVFSNKGERKVFKDHADRLCDRRNYAMHNEEADEDEPFFTRNETGMLLLASINYFNQLTKLVATIEDLP